MNALQMSLSPGMSVGDRPPGLPKRPARLAGPFGSAESPTSTTLPRDEARLRVSLSSLSLVPLICTEMGYTRLLCVSSAS